MKASFPLLVAALVTIGASHEALAQQIVIDPPLPSCTQGEPLTGHVDDLPSDQTYAIATYIYLDGYGDSGDNGWLPKPYESRWPGGSPCTSLLPDGQDPDRHNFSVDVARVSSIGCDEKATKFALYVIPESHAHCDSYWTKWNLEDGDPQAGVEPPLDSLAISRPCSTVDALGYTWVVKDGGGCNPLAPGPCHFNPQNVSDDSGKLHLETYYDTNNGRCEAAEVVLTENLGYGTYVFTVDGSVDVWGDTPILGLFTWDVDVPPTQECVNIHREIDFEFYQGGQLGCGDPNLNAQFVVQPVDCRVCTNQLYPFYMDYFTRTTHVMTWTPTAVKFTSYYGDYRVSPPETGDPDFIAAWTYSGSDNPLPGEENVRMNFYLEDGNQPSNNEVAEVTISFFGYFPPHSVPSLPGGIWIAILVAGSLMLVGYMRVKRLNRVAHRDGS